MSGPHRHGHRHPGPHQCLRADGVPPWLGSLLTDDPARGEELSRALCDLNRERQAIEAEIYTECQAMAEALPQPQRHALVLAGEQWHQGVVGIVASRLAEKYSCPAFMICLQDGKGKAPAASRASTCSPPWSAAPPCWRASAAMPWRRASPSGRRISRPLPPP